MHPYDDFPGIEGYQEEKATGEGAGTKSEQLLPGFDKVGDQQIHGEVAAPLDPDAGSQKGYENAQIPAQLFVPGETIVEKVAGKNLNETDQSKPQDGPDQDRVFHSVYPVGHPTGVFW
jgi:hypothetical protein